jgi:hypothetical protein
MVWQEWRYAGERPPESESQRPSEFAAEGVPDTSAEYI